MKLTQVCGLGSILLLGAIAWAQEFPRAEVGVNYTYARYAPSVKYSQGHSLNGGGGSATFNWNEYLGFKVDLQGYGSNENNFVIPSNGIFPNGLSGKVQGNLFTYLFGPQFKVRAHHLQPFGHILFGAAHTNVYANAFKQICQPIAGGCPISKSPSADAFAMAFGGGVDVPVTKMISIRPAEFDYFLTRFDNPFTGTANQNNFRYSGGIVFTLGNGPY
jgi:hypothetical protein